MIEGVFNLPVTPAGRQCLREALEVFAQCYPELAPYETLSWFDWDESAAFVEELLERHGGQK